MNLGRATFLRLKAHLILRNSNLTTFAANLGTGVSRVKYVVETHTESPEALLSPLSLAIWQAVQAELRDSPLLHVPLNHDEDSQPELSDNGKG